MMRQKTIFPFVIFLILVSCEENSVTPNSNNHRISKILNYAHSTSSQPYGFVAFTYDDDGNLLKESMFDSPNTLTTYKSYEYTNGKLSKKKIFDGYVGNLTLGTYIEYYYTNDKLTKEELRLADGTLKYTTYSEFNGNNLIKTYKVNDELGVHHLYKYAYDDKDRVILEQVFMYDQELSEFTKYIFNGNRLIKKELYNGDGNLTMYVENVYNGSDDLPDGESYFDSNGQLTQQQTLVYDGWGNLVERILENQSSCKLFSKKYDGQLLMEEITFDPSFGCTEWTVSRYEYEIR
jgi:YD repeat-containing protein